MSSQELKEKYRPFDILTGRELHCKACGALVQKPRELNPWASFDFHAQSCPTYGIQHPEALFAKRVPSQSVPPTH